MGDILKREIKILLTLLVLILLFNTYSYSYDAEIYRYQEGPNITSSDRVLIVAPHPDDESISSAGVIRYSVKNKIPIHLLFITNGGKSKLGEERHYETFNATAKLGLPREDIIFLDYPQAVNSLFNENWDEKDFYSDGTTHDQNPFAYQKNASYSGFSLEKNMETVIEDFKPTIIIYPYSNDAHPDHWGTSAFVDYTTNKIDYKTKKYTYLVHVDSLWPFPRSYVPQTYMLPPDFLTNNDKWMVFPLKDSDEKLKFSAINSYKSQIKSDPTYLRSFVRKNELFSFYHDLTILKKNNSPNYIDGNKFPETIFQDPQADIIVKPPLNIYYSTLGNLRDLDITDVGFEIDNNTTWISLQTDGSISPTAIYQFNIRSFENGNVRRMDFLVKNGTVKCLTAANNSVCPEYPLLVKVKDNGMVVEIVSDMFKYKKYMINVEVSNSSQCIDRTGWYTLNINV